jgi:hypothetical protein
MSKYDGHTPGPWEYKSQNNPIEGEEAWYRHVCSMPFLNPEIESTEIMTMRANEADANAALIAAAPDLLRERDEALKDVDEFANKILGLKSELANEQIAHKGTERQRDALRDLLSEMLTAWDDYGLRAALDYDLGDRVEQALAALADT